MGEAVVFTSGKGGVGKTTTVANVGVGLSLLDKKVIMLDTDMGLRNLDVVMGLEDQINYNLMDVLQNKCRLNQAIIQDKRYPNLYFIPASLNCTNISFYKQDFRVLVEQLKTEFDYCLIDCPAGMDSGFEFAIEGADYAVVVTTPHISAVKDARRIIDILHSNHVKSINIVINQYNKFLVMKQNMLSEKDISEFLGEKCLGLVPYDNKVIISQNRGIPVLELHSNAGKKLYKIAQSFVKNMKKECSYEL